MPHSEWTLWSTIPFKDPSLHFKEAQTVLIQIMLVDLRTATPVVALQVERQDMGKNANPKVKICTALIVVRRTIFAKILFARSPAFSPRNDEKRGKLAGTHPPEMTMVFDRAPPHPNAFISSCKGWNRLWYPFILQTSNACHRPWMLEECRKPGVNCPFAPIL